MPPGSITCAPATIRRGFGTLSRTTIWRRKLPKSKPIRAWGRVRAESACAKWYRVATRPPPRSMRPNLRGGPLGPAFRPGDSRLEHSVLVVIRHPLDTQHLHSEFAIKAGAGHAHHTIFGRLRIRSRDQASR